MYCTYPIPFYAHTHFLASIRTTLVLYHINIEAFSASPFFYALRVIQHFSNSLFMNIVKTLRIRQNGKRLYFITSCINLQLTYNNHTKKEVKPSRNSTTPILLSKGSWVALYTLQESTQHEVDRQPGSFRIRWLAILFLLPYHLSKPRGVPVTYLKPFGPSLIFSNLYIMKSQRNSQFSTYPMVQYSPTFGKNVAGVWVSNT